MSTNYFDAFEDIYLKVNLILIIKSIIILIVKIIEIIKGKITIKKLII